MGDSIVNLTRRWAVLLGVEDADADLSARRSGRGARRIEDAMKVTYNTETDTLHIMLTDAMIDESD